MKINKVVYGGATLLDLTEDTINEDVIVEGYVGHDASGEQITGKLKLITVDDELDADSTNPIQNNVVVEALNAKADKSTTYTKTEVDSLLENAGGGSSEDCLSSKGGTFNGETVVYEYEDGTVEKGTVYRATSESPVLMIGNKDFEAGVGGCGIALDNEACQVVSDGMTMLGTFQNGVIICGDFLGDGIPIVMMPSLEAPMDSWLMNMYGTWVIGGKSIVTSVNGYTADALGNIEVPLGGGGGGDDGYFPSNMEDLLGSEMETSTLDAGGVIVGWKVYDSATSTHSPLKYILGISSSTTNQIGMTVACDSFEEILSIVNSEDSFMGLLGNGGTLGHINLVTFQGSTAGLGLVECVKSTEKPLWFVWVGDLFDDIVMPAVGYY